MSKMVDVGGSDRSTEVERLSGPVVVYCLEIARPKQWMHPVVRCSSVHYEMELTGREVSGVA